MGSASINRSARPSLRHVWFLWLFVRCLTFNTSGDTGALDLNFDPGRGADDIVRAIVVEPGGSLLLGGSFRTYDTNACAGLVRLGPDGRMDTDFAPTSDGLCNALALQTNGQFLVGGSFSEIAGAARWHLARFHPGGELDAEFAPALAPDDSVWALAMQDDGRILVGGYLSRIGDHAIRGLTRLLPGGEPDPEFNAGAGTEEGVAALAIQPDGRILVGGHFASFDHHARAGVVRLWPDGSVDETFDAELTGSFLRVNCIALPAAGGVLMGGGFESVRGFLVTGLPAWTKAVGSTHSSPPPRFGRTTPRGQFDRGCSAGQDLGGGQLLAHRQYRRPARRLTAGAG